MKPSTWLWAVGGPLLYLAATAGLAAAGDVDLSGDCEARPELATVVALRNAGLVEKANEAVVAALAGDIDADTRQCLTDAARDINQGSLSDQIVDGVSATAAHSPGFDNGPGRPAWAVRVVRAALWLLPLLWLASLARTLAAWVRDRRPYPVEVVGDTAMPALAANSLRQLKLTPPPKSPNGVGMSLASIVEAAETDNSLAATLRSMVRAIWPPEGFSVTAVDTTATTSPPASSSTDEAASPTPAAVTPTTSGVVRVSAKHGNHEIAAMLIEADTAEKWADAAASFVAYEVQRYQPVSDHLATWNRWSDPTTFAAFASRGKQPTIEDLERLQQREPANVAIALTAAMASLDAADDAHRQLRAMRPKTESDTQPLAVDAGEVATSIRLCAAATHKAPPLIEPRLWLASALLLPAAPRATATTHTADGTTSEALGTVIMGLAALSPPVADTTPDADDAATVKDRLRFGVAVARQNRELMRLGPLVRRRIRHRRELASIVTLSTLWPLSKRRRSMLRNLDIVIIAGETKLAVLDLPSDTVEQQARLDDAIDRLDKVRRRRVSRWWSASALSNLMRCYGHVLGAVSANVQQSTHCEGARSHEPEESIEKRVRKATDDLASRLYLTSRYKMTHTTIERRAADGDIAALEDILTKWFAARGLDYPATKTSDAPDNNGAVTTLHEKTEER